MFTNAFWALSNSNFVHLKVLAGIELSRCFAKFHEFIESHLTENSKICFCEKK